MDPPHPIHTGPPPPEDSEGLTPPLSALDLNSNQNSNVAVATPDANFPINVVLNLGGTTAKESQA